MKKIFMIVAIASFLCCTGFTTTLDNKDYNNVVITDNVDNSDIEMVTLSNGGGTQTCKTLFGEVDDPAYSAYWIQKGLVVIKYLGIAFLLVFSTIDFVNAIVAQDSDAIQKAAKKSFKRLIYAVLLFFVPMIVSFLMNLAGLYGPCGFGEGGEITYVVG